MGSNSNGSANKSVRKDKPGSYSLGQLRQGDRKALAAFFDQTAPMLLAVAMRYLANRQDAEDVMQDSLLKVLQSLDSFTPMNEKSFEAWTKRICVNQSLNFLRKNNRFNEVSNLETERIINTQADEDPEDAELPAQIEPGHLLECIARLPSGYRTVMNLYVFESFSHKEIAETLGISENTSKTQLHKARKFLKAAVSEYSTIKMP
ncbi:MAG: RNA polymerase sigma factor [Bacteroidetes bacterium]|nr:RNA polymerase sigma factor [Bacteroidota bacterium]